MRKLVLLILFTTLITFAQTPQVKIPLLVSDDGASKDTVFFGIDPLATNGIDLTLGEYELPPLPPSGIFDARFTGEDIGIPQLGQGVRSDFRQGNINNPPADSITYEIKYQVGTGTKIIIQWNLPDNVSGRITDLFGGIIVSKNVIGSDSLVINNPSIINKLIMKIKYSPSIIQNLQLTSPIGGENWKVGTVQNITWISSNINKIKIEYTTNNGSTWLTISDSVDANLNTYQWNIPNTPSTNCKVRISNYIGGTPNAISPNVFTISVSTEPEVKLHLHISDNLSASDTLWFGKDPSATNGIDSHLGEFELPPTPPIGVFDSRFSGEDIAIPQLGQGVKKDFRFGSATSVDTIIHQIKYQPISGSIVKIKWNFPANVSGILQDFITGTIINKTMNGADSLVISNTFINKLKMTIFYGAPVPNVLISGYVFKNDSTALPDVILNFSNGGGSATTNLNGYYEKSIPSGWSGTVTPSKTNWNFNPVNRNYTNVSTNQLDQNYIATPSSLIITGYVRTIDSLALGGVLLTFSNSGGSATTDSTGYYSHTVPYNWSGTVTPSKSNWNFDPVSRTYTNLTSNQINQNYTATPTFVTISGYVKTADTLPLSGVLMSFSNGGNSVVSDSNGYYSASLPYNWSGSLVPSKTNWQFIPAVRNYTNLITNQTNQNFVAYSTNLKISGFVRATDSAAISGVLIKFSNGIDSVISNSQGYYEQTVPFNWSGTVTPSKANYTFNPIMRNYDSIKTNQTNQNFTGITSLIFLTLTSPVGGEIFPIGVTRNITWQSSNVANIKIEFTTNNGNTWITLINSYPAYLGSYPWLVSNTPSNQCKVKISETTTGTPFSISPNTFTIQSNPLGGFSLVSPQNNSRFVVHKNDTSKINFVWTKSNNSAKYRLSINESVSDYIYQVIELNDTTIGLTEKDFWDYMAVLSADSLIFKWTVWSFNNFGTDSLRADTIRNVKIVRDLSSDIKENTFISDYYLYQNYPNPFNPVTTIQYEIPQTLSRESSTHPVQLRILDILGREVEMLVNSPQSPGRYSITWNAAQYPSGVYYYELRAGSYYCIKKMILIK